MAQSLQRAVLRAIEQQSVSPEFREMWEGGCFCVGDGGVAFELRITECKESKRCYLASIMRGEGVLSKSVEKC
jgi:hypothetical protein